MISEHLGSFQKKPADALQRDEQAVQMLHGTVEFEFQKLISSFLGVISF